MVITQFFLNSRNNVTENPKNGSNLYAIEERHNIGLRIFFFMKLLQFLWKLLWLHFFRTAWLMCIYQPFINDKWTGPVNKKRQYILMQIWLRYHADDEKMYWNMWRQLRIFHCVLLTCLADISWSGITLAAILLQYVSVHVNLIHLKKRY